MRRRGSIAITTALLIAGLVGFAGLAIDSTRIWLVRERLQTALDASALVAARQMSSSGLTAAITTTATEAFWMQFSQGGGNHSFMGATVGSPGFTSNTSTSSVVASATATVPVTMLGIFTNQITLLSDSSTVQREGTGLEVALVLDTTPSMNDSSGIGSETNLQAAESAIGTLLGILYGSSDTQQNLWVSLVPFSRTINIGSSNTSLLNTSGINNWNASYWSGCVEALRNGSDTLDAAPTGTDAFTPFWWPSTYQQVGSVGTGRCSNSNYNTANSNAYAATTSGDKSTAWCHGDNDWVNTPGNGPSGIANNAMYSYLVGYGLTGSKAIGPSILCAASSIQPLTASKSTLQTVLNNVQAPARSSGTTTVVGLQGAWYTLSPNFQGVWADPNTAYANTPTLPLAYNTQNMKKVIIMLTDGADNWQEAYPNATSNSCGTSSNSVCSSASGTELLYNAYGRAATYNAAFPSAPISPVGTTAADTALNARFTAVCNAIKATGTVVYIIGFGVASSDEARLQACASSSSDYFSSPTASTLDNAFSQIGNQLASLRIVQ